MTDKRYYALDALRAMMMLLGLVLHSAISYASSDEPWPLKDNHTSVVFRFLVDFIHSFRMPIFFLMSGFFGALLFYKKSPKYMIVSRFKRVFLPFIVFLILLNPFMGFALKYAKAVVTGSGHDFINHFSSLWSYIPMRTAHLWFLYYLFIISLILYGVSQLMRYLPLNLKINIDALFKRTFSNPLFRFILLSVGTFVILYLSNVEAVETSVQFLVDVNILLYYLFFYVLGWLLFRSNTIMETMKHWDIFFFMVGIVLFSVKFTVQKEFSMLLHQIVNALTTTSLVLGTIGLFIRFVNKPNAFIQYLVPASYWVYLIHLVAIIFVCGFLRNLDLSAYIKFTITLLKTSFISFASYHFMIRNSFVQTFLMGKKGSK